MNIVGELDTLLITWRTFAYNIRMREWAGKFLSSLLSLVRVWLVRYVHEYFLTYIFHFMATSNIGLVNTWSQSNERLGGDDLL